MAGLFVRLKLSLIAGSLRGPGRAGRIAGLVTALVGAAWVAPLAFFALAAQHGAAGVDSFAAIVFTACVVGWLVLPLITFGADETLDPARLALLPLSTGELARGLLAAALTGIGPVVTLLLLLGAVAAAADGPGSVLVGLAAALINLLLCVTGSRALVTSLSRLLRSRRGRDLGVLVTALLVLGIYGASLVFQHYLATTGVSGGHPVGVGLGGAARLVRWLPSGMVADAVTRAAGGQYSIALIELAVGAATVMLAIALWMAALRRTLESFDASTLVGGSRRGNAASGASEATAPRVSARWIAGPRIWGSRALTTAGRELRYYRRDPRRKQQLVSLAMPVFMVTASSLPLAHLAARPGASTALPAWPAIVAGMIGGLVGSANQFGLDGSALWLHLSVTARWQDLRADIAGKSLAGALISVPVFACVYLVVGIWTRDAGAALVSWSLAVCALGATSGVAAILGVFVPVPVPERRTNTFSSPGAGQGCLAGLLTLGGMAAAVVLMVPVLIVRANWHTVVPLTVVAIGYGATLAWAGRQAAAIAAFRRMPELLAQVSKPV